MSKRSRITTSYDAVARSAAAYRIPNPRPRPVPVGKELKRLGPRLTPSGSSEACCSTRM